MSNNVVEVKYDSYHNLIYEKHEDGYEEFNTYDSNNNLVRSECRYANGIVEIENFKGID